MSTYLTEKWRGGPALRGDGRREYVEAAPAGGRTSGTTRQQDHAPTGQHARGVGGAAADAEAVWRWMTVTPFRASDDMRWRSRRTCTTLRFVC